MRELRLLPAALLSWLVVLSVIITRQAWAAVALIAIAMGLTAMVKQWGQVLTVSVLGAATALVAGERVQAAERFVFPETITGTVESSKKLG